MKKHYIIITVIILSGILFFVSGTKNPITRVNQETTKPQHSELNYLLKDYNGRIALFYQNEEKPIEVYDIFTNSLPEKDAQRIKGGITVSTDELNNLLSDYIS